MRRNPELQKFVQINERFNTPQGDGCLYGTE